MLPLAYAVALTQSLEPGKIEYTLTFSLLPHYPVVVGRKIRDDWWNLLALFIYTFFHGFDGERPSTE